MLLEKIQSTDIIRPEPSASLPGGAGACPECMWGLTEGCCVPCLPGGSSSGAVSAAGAPGGPAAPGAAERRGWPRTARTTPMGSTGSPFWSLLWRQAFKTRQEEFLRAAYWHQVTFHLAELLHWTPQLGPGSAGDGHREVEGGRDWCHAPACWLPRHLWWLGWTTELLGWPKAGEMEITRKRGGSRSCFDILY